MPVETLDDLDIEAMTLSELVKLESELETALKARLYDDAGKPVRAVAVILAELTANRLERVASGLELFGQSTEADRLRAGLRLTHAQYRQWANVALPF